MSTLSSSSTNDEVWNAYDDNASFEEDASLSKAKAFVTACRILLRRQPQRFAVDGQMGEFNASEISAEMQRAQVYIAEARGAGRSIYRDLRDQRS